MPTADLANFAAGTPGVYDGVPFPEYLACPALSHSVLVRMMRSPRYAWRQSFLNPNYRPDEPGSDAPEIGTLAHAMVLDGCKPANLVVIDAENFRTKAAQQERDAARAAGKLPILARKVQEVQEMVGVAECFLGEAEDLASWAKGRSEQSVLWREGETLCRCRPDRMIVDGVTRIIDVHYKTTTNASPAAFEGLVVPRGYDIEAAWYARGLRAAYPGHAVESLFIVQEIEPPYDCCLFALDPEFDELASKRMGFALARWLACAAAGEWPGYSTRTHWLSPKPWHKMEWESVIEQQEEA